MIALSNRPIDRRISIEGQSNAVGWGDSDISHLSGISDTTLIAMTSSTFQRVYIFNPASGNYEKLLVGINNMGQDASHIGPEFGIAARWMRETVSGNLYIDKNASPGQPISYFMEGTSVFTALLTNTTAQNAWLTARRLRPTHMGWLWVQGEADNYATQASYEASLTTYINSRLSRALNTDNGFCLLAQVPVGTSQFGAGVQAAKSDYISLYPKIAKSLAYGQIGADNLHMNAKGMVQMAYDAYSILFSRPQLILI